MIYKYNYINKLQMYWSDLTDKRLFYKHNYIHTSIIKKKRNVTKQN